MELIAAGDCFSRARVNIDGTAQLFVYLQTLDFVTTLVGMRMGATEASPFISLLMRAGPVAGLLISKLVALALGAACLYLRKRHLLRLASYWYAALVMWNLLVIEAALSRIHG